MAYEVPLLLAFCVSLVWGLSDELWKCGPSDLSRPVLNIGFLAPFGLVCYHDAPRKIVGAVGTC